MLTAPVSDLLRAHRSHFNQRYAAARQRWPHLDPADFSLFLRDQFSPLIHAIATIAPDHATGPAHAAYDLGLQLVAEKLAGPSARDPLINSLWAATLPLIAPLIARDAHRLIGGLCNLAHHVASTPDSRRDFWLSRLGSLGPRATSVEQLILIAQLLAWRSGLAHVRRSALESSSALPASLALAALDAPPHSSWPETQSNHLQNPWYGYNPDFQLILPASASRRIGAFRGLGGCFVSPPLVSTSGEHVLVRSGDETWLLAVDVFGATFHRASPAESADLPALNLKSLVGSLRDFVPPEHTPTSCAVTAHTFALTTAQSHCILVGPRPAA